MIRHSQRLLHSFQYWTGRSLCDANGSQSDQVFCYDKCNKSEQTLENLINYQFRLVGYRYVEVQILHCVFIRSVHFHSCGTSRNVKFPTRHGCLSSAVVESHSCSGSNGCCIRASISQAITRLPEPIGSYRSVWCASDES